jgi:serine/threonine protein kinase
MTDPPSDRTPPPLPLPLPPLGPTIDHLWRGGAPDLSRVAALVATLPPNQAADLLRDDLVRRRRGQAVRVEDYLRFEEVRRLGEEAILDLIYAEFVVREQQQERPSVEDYYARFPQYVERLQRQFLVHGALAAPTPMPEPDPTVPAGDSAAREQQEQLARTEPARTEPSRCRPCPEGPFPQPFGRYELLERLGAGGMADVYLAHDSVLDHRVAVKVPRVAPDDHLREARAAARLNHPNLCRIFDCGSFENVAYLSMEYVPGRPLPVRPLRPPNETAELVRTLALALEHAHAQGVVHRDLKPGNILLTVSGRPVITDFGLAVRLGSADLRLLPVEMVCGTPPYMAPEQVEPQRGAPGPATDIWALGVLLYELLTGHRPFAEESFFLLSRRILYEEPLSPAALRRGLDPALATICLRALKKQPGDRFLSMSEFAAALARYLADPHDDLNQQLPLRPVRIAADCIRFAFAGFGQAAPAASGPADRLYLDVGGDLRPGVLDHHNLSSSVGSTASLALRRPELMDAAVVPGRQPDDPFTIVLHQYPDLDGMLSAWLACVRLTTGSFPAAAEALARYADLVEAGALGMQLQQPFGLYAAYRRLTERLEGQPFDSVHERWQTCVRLGLRLADFMAEQVAAGTPVAEIDAFACPGLFTEEDRKAILADAERYEAKLRQPRCQARQALLRLPGVFGGWVSVWGLLVRDVQNADDPERCSFFKDWARSDVRRCPNGHGYAALCVFMSEGARQPRRCILSVTPDSGATLRGLGELLDDAEAARRRVVHGHDDRRRDPITGEPKSPRPGYGNSDPWYDGRGHGYTIVDAPNAGTVLTAEAIETLFLRFGGVAPEEVQALPEASGIAE